MKIKIMTMEAIKYVKENLDYVSIYYTQGKDPQIWLKEKLGKDAFVEVPDLEFNQCSLIISEETPASTDPENIKLFYLNFKEINDSFASDERLWAGLAHTIYYEYMLKRWPGKTDPQSIKNHFFFASGQRSYMLNTMSRLWWFGRKTYREGNEPWKILDYFSHDINGFGFTLFGSNWSNSEISTDLFFKAIFEYTEENHRKVDRQLFNDARVYTTCLCGIYVLDACDYRFIIDQIKKYLNDKYEEHQLEAEYNKQNNVRTTGIDRLDNIIKAFNRIGGQGKFSDILKAFEAITQKNISIADKEYIQKQLNINNPESNSYSGKPMFYRIRYNGIKGFKIANEYLTKENIPNRRDFIQKQMDILSDRERWTLNFITAIRKDKFTIDDVIQFSSQYKAQHTSVEEPDKEMRTAIRDLSEKGLLEILDGKTIKKAYNIKKDC